MAGPLTGLRVVELAGIGPGPHAAMILGDLGAELLAGLGLDSAALPAQYDEEGWPELRSVFTAAFASRTRDEWATAFADRDACVTPVLSFAEAPAHPHIAARDTVIEIDGSPQAAPAPRFSRTPPGPPAAPPKPGADTDAVLRDWGVDHR